MQFSIAFWHWASHVILLLIKIDGQNNSFFAEFIETLMSILNKFGQVVKKIQ